MVTTPHRAIILIGREEPAAAVFREAERYDEVFVLARAVAESADSWVIDDDRSHEAARARLARTVRRLRGRGVRASGAVGDENPASARADALALFPADAILA